MTLPREIIPGRFYLITRRCTQRQFLLRPDDRLVNAEDVIRKLVYTALNPVAAHLVEKVHQWPGVNGLAALLRQQPLVAYRPRHFFRPDGPMPETVSLPLVIPPELGDCDQVLAELRTAVLAKEADIAAERRRSGAAILGRRGVKQQSWRDSPASREPRRNLRPTIAARSPWSRVEAILRNRHFLIAYRAARNAWLLGTPTTFPTGTYWLSRFANVPIET